MDIKIKIVPNPLYGRPGSLVECEYMGQVVHTGTATAADICEACKQENPQMTEPLASLATETIMDYGSDRVVTDVVRFNLGSAFFTMEPAVSGSVPTVDAALTDANERYIRVVNGPSLNARIAALRPVITGDDLGDVQFRSTETASGEKEWKNTIFGDEEFVALGKRLGGADQRMELVAADGTVVSTATFLGGDALGQRFRYRLATPPAQGGAYTLVLTSTGKDTPDASPKTIPVKVTVLPKRIRITLFKYYPDMEQYDIFGTNFDAVTGYTVREDATVLTGKLVYADGTSETVEIGKAAGLEPEAYFAIVPSRPLASGETVTVELTPNPARTDVDQAKVSATCTAE